jgi:calmodulin
LLYAFNGESNEKMDRNIKHEYTTRHQKFLEVRERLLPVLYTRKIEKEIEVVVNTSTSTKHVEGKAAVMNNIMENTKDQPNEEQIQLEEKFLLDADTFIKERIKNIFQALDLDNTGEVNRDCLGRAFQTLELGLKQDEVDAVMADIDVNNDGTIELDEFEEWFLQQDPVAILVEAQYDSYIKDRKEMAQKIFVAIDLDKQGEIGRDCLGRGLNTVLDMDLSMQELDVVMSDIDVNNDETIKLDKFQEWFFQQDPVAILMEAQYNTFIKRIRLEMSKNIFAAINFSNTGTVNRKILGKAFKAFKMGLSEEQIDLVMLELLNGDNGLVVNESQFRVWFLKQSKICLLLQEKVETIFHNDPAEEERRNKETAKIINTSTTPLEKENSNSKIQNAGSNHEDKAKIIENFDVGKETDPTTSTTTTISNTTKRKNNVDNGRASKIPKFKGSHGGKNRKAKTNSTTSPARRQKQQRQRGHLSAEKIEENRKAAERRNAQYQQQKRAEQRRKKEKENKKKKAIAEALKRVDHLPQNNNMKVNRNNQTNRTSGSNNSSKKSRRRQERNKRSLLSYGNKSYNEEKDKDNDIPGRTIFKKKSVHHVHVDSGPVTFFVRDNEQLSIDSVEGYGQLSMTVMDQQGQLVVQNAMIFDSKAFFYLNGAPAKISGDPIYPGLFRYDFFMRESADVLNQVGNNIVKDEPFLSVTFTLFSEFFKEEKIDPTSSLRLSSDRMKSGWSAQTRMLNPIKNAHSGYRVHNNSNNVTNLNDAKINPSMDNSNNTISLLAMGRNDISNTKYRAESVSRGIENTRHNSILSNNEDKDPLYVSPNSRPKTIGHVNDAIDSLLDF